MKLFLSSVIATTLLAFSASAQPIADHYILHVKAGADPAAVAANHGLKLNFLPARSSALRPTQTSKPFRRTMSFMLSVSLGPAAVEPQVVPGKSFRKGSNELAPRPAAQFIQAASSVWLSLIPALISPTPTSTPRPPPGPPTAAQGRTTKVMALTSQESSRQRTTL